MPRSIEDIIPPSRRRMMEGEEAGSPAPVAPETAPVTPIGPTPPPTPPPVAPAPSADVPPPMPPQRVKINVGRSFPYGTAIVAILVIAASAFALYAFSGAKVEITPESQPVTINGSFTATQGGGDLPFTVVTVTKTASTSVPAESTQTANDSAQGTIVISNTNTKPESLITNTRFQTPTGLIYRVHKAIVIPAATASGPGTLTVTVYADQAGQQYNIGPTTFTVPGLQNTPAFTQITAKSSGPMMGGFSGTRASVSSTTDTSKQMQLQQSLATSLQQALKGQIPAGYVVLNGGNTTSYQALPDSATTTNSVLITEQGTMTAIAFPADALAKAIANQAVGSYSGVPVSLSSVSGLTMSGIGSQSGSTTASSTATTDITSASTLTFTLQGNTTVIWKVDTSKIAGAVAGKTRDSAQQILTGFPEVNKAVLVLRPFWASTFPQDPSHIKVTVSTISASQAGQ